MTKSNNGWTERRRKQQACNARRNKPWESSTGPKTQAGKKAARLNALKHGYYAAGYEEVRIAMRLNREFLRHIAAWYAYDRIYAETLKRKRTEGKTNKNKEELPTRKNSGQTD